MLSKVNGESTMARSKVYEWHRHFKKGRESIEYIECIGRPSTSRNAKNVALVSECVRKNCRLTLEQISFISDSVTTGIFCMTTYQHIDSNWQKSSSPILALMCFQIPPIHQT
ncbi:hypothetical protein TNCV_977151 [Trichonephila clavipes]|nr:hypothetical protein TNCV_977151 [Trichonephila clavipes]